VADEAQASRPTIDLTAALKHAGLAAAVAFGLFSLLIGIRTETGPTGALVLDGRVGVLAIFVGVAFIGVFAREVLLRGEPLGIARYVPASMKVLAARSAPFAAPHSSASPSSSRSCSTRTAICSISASRFSPM